MNELWLIVTKDLRAELRRPESLISMVFFGFLLLVVLNLAIPLGTEVAPETGAGILWVAITFAFVLGLARTMSREKENRCLDGLLLSPLTAESLFGAKMVVNLVLLLLAELSIIPLFFILYGDSALHSLVMFIVVVLLANTGFAATGTLFSAITAGTSRNEALLPLLFYPVIIPLVSITVKATGMIFLGAAMAEYVSWLYVMAAYGLIFTGLGVLLFGHIITE
ncbi:heme exporter protein CcmB [Desulfolithobacter sp.]